MKPRPPKPPRKGDQTDELLRGSDEQVSEHHEQFGDREKHTQHRKMARTAALRAEGAMADDIESLPIGQVTQVYSHYFQVDSPAGSRLCVVRKTLAKLAKTAIVVGDQVRYRDGKPGEEAVIELVLPRRTVLTRANSFRSDVQQPIVANAEQMLLVASLTEPAVKWGLIDRMIVAAKSGGLTPIICLNKIDLAESELSEARQILAHYAKLGIRAIQTSVTQNIGLDLLREVLVNHTTVLAGHSGVGKSSLIAAIQPGLDIRIGEISHFTAKGRHTTTSARRYDLDAGGCVIDTPGVKLFGLWGVTRESLIEFFPDVADGTAPDWRKESYQRLAESLPSQPAGG